MLAGGAQHSVLPGQHGAYLTAIGGAPGGAGGALGGSHSALTLGPNPMMGLGAAQVSCLLCACRGAGGSPPALYGTYSRVCTPVSRGAEDVCVTEAQSCVSACALLHMAFAPWRTKAAKASSTPHLCVCAFPFLGTRLLPLFGIGKSLQRCQFRQSTDTIWGCIAQAGGPAQAMDPGNAYYSMYQQYSYPQ